MPSIASTEHLIVPPPDLEVARSLAADDQRRLRTAAASAAEAAARRRAGAGRQPQHPRQRQLLHVRLIDLLERAEAAARVIAVVGDPVGAERLEQFGGRDAAALRQQQGGDEEERERASHFRVTR